MQIQRFLSLNEAQLLGCASAFVDALDSEMRSALSYLQRLEDTMKGRAFGFEMQLDKHRYGALIVLERWAEFAASYAGTATVGGYQAMLTDARTRVNGAVKLLETVNRTIDAAEVYSGDIVEACGMAFHAVETTFQEEREAVQRVQALEAAIPEDYRHYRSVFAGDLAVR